EGAGVERDPELLLERAGERRVEHRLAAQLELDVAAVAAQREGTQEDGGAVLAVGTGTGGEADAEADGVDPAGARQLEPLRRDAVGGEPRGAESHVVADE